MTSFCNLYALENPLELNTALIEAPLASMPSFYEFAWPALMPSLVVEAGSYALYQNDSGAATGIGSSVYF